MAGQLSASIGGWFSRYSARRGRESVIQDIVKSDLFDYRFYRAQSNLPAWSSRQLVEHYLEIGSELGLKPNPLFCPNFYRSKNPDVCLSEIEPFHHFLVSGYRDSRDPHPLFSLQHYREQLGDESPGSDLNLLKHYFDEGAETGLSPYPLFDPDYYLQQCLGAGFNTTGWPIQGVRRNRLVEFLEFGGGRGFSPHPLFDSGFYLHQCPQLIEADENPLLHFVEHGVSGGLNPHPLFWVDFYLEINRDVQQAGVNPLVHYLRDGEREERVPSPLFDPVFYRHSYLSNSDTALSPLMHFVTQGWRRGLNPSPWINSNLYLQSGAFKTFRNDDWDSLISFFSDPFRSDLIDYVAPELFSRLSSDEQVSKEKRGRSYRKLFQSIKRYRSYHYSPQEDSNVEAFSQEQRQINGLAYFAPLGTISGLGEASRGYFKAMKSQGVLCRSYQIPPNSHQRRVDFPPSFVTTRWPVALAHVNADSLYAFLQTDLGQKFLDYQYRIGFWVWELSSFQSRWWVNLGSFDEIWVPSRFCRQALQGVTNRPVKWIPHVVTAPPKVEDPELLDQCRSKFGLPADGFSFLYVFDVSSYIERKNPFALLEAFVREFASEKDAFLVLKASYPESNPRFMRKLKRFLRSNRPCSDRIVVITEKLTREELTNLFQLTDCYVSPHRSEGFGLTLAEALILEKPVVATNFGGSVDFLTEETGFPVDYSLVEIKRDVGPYLAGNLWANPIGSALQSAMREVKNDVEGAVRKARQGRALLEERYSEEAIGKLINSRLAEISRGH